MPVTPLLTLLLQVLGNAGLCLCCGACQSQRLGAGDDVGLLLKTRALARPTLFGCLRRRGAAGAGLTAIHFGPSTFIIWRGIPSMIFGTPPLPGWRRS